MSAYAWVALGSALGGVARYWCTGAAAALWGGDFPWGTVLINIAGSFVIGFASALSAPAERAVLPLPVQQFLIPGLCGGFTTFSAFSQQTLNLLHDGNPAAAGANVALSVALCLVSVWLGHLAATALNAARPA